MTEFNILIGGSAGQGMDTIATLLEKAIKRTGYQIFSTKDYMSRVRGGHNFIQIRFGTKPLFSHLDEIDLILALNKESIESHIERLKPKGRIICDLSIDYKSESTIHLELEQTARKIGNPRVMGTVAAGAAIKLLGLPSDKLLEVVNQSFSGAILDANLSAAQSGYNMTESMYTTPLPNKDDKMLINGNQAIALGALAAGCKFYSAYPMTPSTSIMNYLAKKTNEAGIVVEQAEDEIAAINMALGASYAGVRAMTGTSGGGFSLMVESLGLAGMLEIPLVIAEVQRPGPATGFPTRTEQSDLKFVISASHGEAPRMVIALRDPADAFYQTVRAFNLADKYQIPVILLSDQFLADSSTTISPLDFSKVKIERHLANGDELDKAGGYKRYAFTHSGVSPRIIPGKHPGHVVLVDSDEHDQEGHITESAEVRVKMMDKRLKKLKGLESEINEPIHLGHPTPETLVLAWGSTYGPVKEAVERLYDEGKPIGALVFGDIWPLPTGKLHELAKGADKIVNIEQNATGQLASLVREAALIPCNKSILKYDGRPFSGREIYNRLSEEVL